jgi:hypothetical protein
MPLISLFKGIKNIRFPKDYDFYDSLYKIRDGEWQDLIIKCRQIKDKTERDEFKDTLPRLCFSGQFETRTNAGLINHSGYIAMDLDLESIERTVELKELLKKDRWVAAVFQSASGDGLRPIFRIKGTKHRESFLGISEYIRDTYGEICDSQSIAVSKPFIVSWDPDLYIAHIEPPVWNSFPKETEIKKITTVVHTSADFQEVLNRVKATRTSICESYGDWLKLGFAFSEQFGGDGRQFFHDISELSSKYNYNVCNKQYDYCLKHKGQGIGISSFYYLCKHHGISVVSEQTKVIIRATRNGKKAGLSQQQISENLDKFQNIKGAEEVIKQVYESKEAEDSDEDSVLEALEIYISNNFNLRMNEVTGYLEQGNKQMSPGDLNSIFISAKKLIPKLDYPLMMRLLKSDFIKTYNPFYEFLGSDGIAVDLPPMPEEDEDKIWSSPLIDELSKTIVNDNEAYTKYFLRKWFVSMISAMHKVHSPLLLALLGEKHGTGKTEWFRRLLPKEMQIYYAESKLDKEKDDELLMCENILIVDDELGGKSKRDNEKLKNLTSKQYFSLRRPYGDHNEKILRLALLGGTSNKLSIISDNANRRIIPIEVHDIDKKLYNSINKKDLFLEAFRLYKDGFDWRVNIVDQNLLNKDIDNYKMVTSERELISKYFNKGNDKSPRLTTTEIKVEIELLTRQRLSGNQIGSEMLSLGYERKSTREANGSTPKKWIVERINRPGLTTDISNIIKPEDMPF